MRNLAAIILIALWGFVFCVWAYVAIFDPEIPGERERLEYEEAENERYFEEQRRQKLEREIYKAWEDGGR